MASCHKSGSDGGCLARRCLAIQDEYTQLEADPSIVHFTGSAEVR